MKLYPGTFISFEGIDGAGKSTNALAFVQELTNRGFDAIYVREPGGTYVGEALRKIVIQNLPETDKPCKETELLIYMASRMQVINKIIEPALNAGKIVVADRFYDSTIAMQGYARNNIEQTKELVKLFLKDFKPHLTFFLEIDTAFQEITLKDKEKDRFENEPFTFHENVRLGFEGCIQEDPERFARINVKDNGTFRSVASIQAELFEILKQKGM